MQDDAIRQNLTYNLLSKLDHASHLDLSTMNKAMMPTCSTLDFKH